MKKGYNDFDFSLNNSWETVAMQLLKQGKSCEKKTMFTQKDSSRHKEAELWIWHETLQKQKPEKWQKLVLQQESSFKVECLTQKWGVR